MSLTLQRQEKDRTYPGLLPPWRESSQIDVERILRVSQESILESKYAKVRREGGAR